MNKLIFYIMVFVPALASAQSEPPISQGARYYEFKNTIRVDSGLLLPRGDTFFLRQSLKAPGDLRWRPTDSLLYYYRGDRWLPVSAGGAIIPPLDTVTIVGNTSRRPIYIQGLYDFFTNPLTGVGLGYDSTTRSGVLRVRSQLGTGGRLLVVADSMEVNPVLFFNTVPTELPAAPGYFLSLSGNSKVVKDTLNVAAVAGLQDSLNLRPPVSSLDGRYIQNQNAANQLANWQISGNGEAEILRARTRLEASQYWRLSGSLTGLSFEDDNGNLPLFLDATSVYATGNLTATGGNYSFDMGGLATPRNYTLQNFNNVNQLGTTSHHFIVIDPATGRLKYLPAATALGGYIPLTQKGAADGVATLAANGKIPSSQIPAIAISETFVVNSEAAMLAVAAETGDVAVRQDLSKSFILATNPASTLANWQELLTPTAPVQSVNGQTGNVSLTTTLVPEGISLYFTQARARAALSAGTGISYDNTTGVISNIGITSMPTLQQVTTAGSTTNVNSKFTGSLGVGPTTNSFWKLHVDGLSYFNNTIANKGDFELRDGADFSAGRFGMDGTTPYLHSLERPLKVGTWYAYGLSFLTNNIERIGVSAAGDVGIGMPPDANYKLRVLGSTYLAGPAQVGTPGVGFTLLGNGDNIATGWLGFYKPDNTRLGYIGSDPNNMRYVAENGAKHVFLGGNVGIGLDFPDTKLHVDGAVKSSNMSIAGRGYFATGPVDNAYGSGSVTFMDYQSGEFRRGRLGVFNFSTSTWDNLTINEGGGNVGVNTVTPTSSIQVNGSVAFASKLLTGVTLAYTLTERDYSIVNESIAGPPTITLPDPTTCPGRIYVLIDNTVDLTANGMNWTPAVKYKGATYTNFNNAALSQFRTIQIQAIAGSWYIINH